MKLVPPDHPTLHTVAREVPHDEDCTALIKRMFEVIDDPKTFGVGLAAPQLGMSRRIIVVNYASERRALINPTIVKSPGKIVTSIDEGCLSFPGEVVNVKRSKRVIVTGFDESWLPVTVDARNFLAFVFQHEIDHLNGVTIV